MSGKYEKQEKKIGWFISTIILSLLLILLISFIGFNFNWEIRITPTKQIEVNDINEISPPNAKCIGRIICKDGFNVPVTLKSQTNNGNVTTSVYCANWLWFKSTYEHSVKVNDITPPVITLTKSDITMLPTDEFVEPGYQAIDDRDGDITNSVHVFQSYDKIIYFAEDSSGNSTFAERKIIREDKESPVITLTNGESITICKDIPFKEPGFIAVDNCGGDLTDRVVVTGNVDVTNVGSYELQYKVYDDYDNCAIIKRTVHVVETLSNEGNGKTIYLTFDDGPSSYTKDLLQILEQYKVKATFFVVGNGSYTNIIKKIAEGGHSIGIHSVAHTYKDIYKSEEAFLNDLYTMQNIIKEQCGIETYLMRFPGGSSNTVSKNYCNGIMTILTKKVEELGFEYFDWNVSSGDAGGTTTPEGVVNNVINGVSKQKSDAVVLQHDTKKFSVEAVEKIIVWGLEHGYTFAAIDMNSPTAHHGINN